MYSVDEFRINKEMDSAYLQNKGERTLHELCKN